MKATEQWEMAQEYLISRGYEIEFNTDADFTEWLESELKSVNNRLTEYPHNLNGLKEAFDWGYDMGTAKAITEV